MSDTSLPDAEMPDGLITLIKTATRALVAACAVPGSTGPQRVNQITGHSPGTISRWQGDAHKDLIPVEVVFLLEFTIQKPIFSRTLASLTSHRIEAMAAGDATASDLGVDVFRAASAGARAVATLADGLEDGRLSHREKQEILKAKRVQDQVWHDIERKLVNLPDAPE